MSRSASQGWRHYLCYTCECEWRERTGDYLNDKRLSYCPNPECPDRVLSNFAPVNVFKGVPDFSNSGPDVVIIEKGMSSGAI